MRLVDGSASNEGRVEICEGGKWGTICDDIWTIKDAIVLCRQMGYNGSCKDFIIIVLLIIIIISIVLVLKKISITIKYCY